MQMSSQAISPAFNNDQAISNANDGSRGVRQIQLPNANNNSALTPVKITAITQKAVDDVLGTAQDVVHNLPDSKESETWISFTRNLLKGIFDIIKSGLTAGGLNNK